MDIGLHRLLHVVAAIGRVGCCQDGHTGIECGHDASLYGMGEEGKGRGGAVAYPACFNVVVTVSVNDCICCHQKFTW